MVNGCRDGLMRPRYAQCSLTSWGVSGLRMIQYGVSIMSSLFGSPNSRLAKESMSEYIPGSIQSSGSRIAIQSPFASRTPRLQVAP